MTTESNEQYRAGFEAAIRKINPDVLERWPGGQYKHVGTEGRWKGWCMAMQQREASTEPSVGKAEFGALVDRLHEIANQTPMRTNTSALVNVYELDEIARKLRGFGAGALPDDALLSACRNAATALAHAASNPLYASAYEELSAAIEAHTKAGSGNA
jgi:hypothetical protein